VPRRSLAEHDDVPLADVSGNWKHKLQDRECGKADLSVASPKQKRYSEYGLLGSALVCPEEKGEFNVIRERLLGACEHFSGCLCIRVHT